MGCQGGMSRLSRCYFTGGTDVADTTCSPVNFCCKLVVCGAVGRVEQLSVVTTLVNENLDGSIFEFG